MPPNFNRADKEANLLEYRMRHQAVWWEDLPAFSDNAQTVSRKMPWPNDSGGIVVIDANAADLGAIMRQTARCDAQVQLITLSRTHRRIRCNSPFVPGKHTARDMAYVKRVYSYFH